MEASSRAPGSRPSGETWVGPAAGFVSGVVVFELLRVAHWPHAREVALPVMLVVMILVTTYRNGGLRRHPGRVLALMVASAVLGAAIGYIPT
jgi:hypothetical protein